MDDAQREQVSTDPIDSLLESASFPVERDTLLRLARERNVDRQTIERIANLPQSRYADAAAVRQSWANDTPDSSRVGDLSR